VEEVYPLEPPAHDYPSFDPSTFSSFQPVQPVLPPLGPIPAFSPSFGTGNEPTLSYFPSPAPPHVYPLAPEITTPLTEIQPLLQPNSYLPSWSHPPPPVAATHAATHKAESKAFYPSDVSVIFPPASKGKEDTSVDSLSTRFGEFLLGAKLPSSDAAAAAAADNGAIPAGPAKRRKSKVRSTSDDFSALANQREETDGLSDSARQSLYVLSQGNSIIVVLTNIQTRHLLHPLSYPIRHVCSEIHVPYDPT
jgi:hypothetical protein